MTKPSFDYEKVDELFKNAKSIEDITGKNGFLQETFKGTIERLLKAEMEDHLGYAENDRSSKQKASNKRSNLMRIIPRLCGFLRRIYGQSRYLLILTQLYTRDKFSDFPPSIRLWRPPNIEFLRAHRRRLPVLVHSPT